MSTSRRSFIKNGSVAIAGAAVLPKLLIQQKNPHIMLGLQLYTVRDDMKNDPAGTLKKVAAIGYKYVEAAGYEDGKFYGYSIPDFKKLLSDTGLKMLSGHSFLGSKQWDAGKNDFTDEWKQTIQDAAAVGMKYLISPGVDESLCKNMVDFKHYMDMFDKTGMLCKKAGIKFAFHNESYEFNHDLDGKVLYDLILQTTDKNLVVQQIDIGNMYATGGRAMHFLKKYPGRFPLMHVKDEMKKNVPGKDGSTYESTLLGKGVVGVKEIVDYARKNGTNYFIIEQEEYQNITPLESAAADYKTMKDWGF
jgi:sugar phosphate isomerase/epimerase